MGTDISNTALALAKKNGLHNQIGNATFFKSNLFASISGTFTFDLIISNPPYIDQQEWAQLEPSVKEWEDKQALVADSHGLAIIEQIIMQAPTYLKKDGPIATSEAPQLVIEIGHTQAKDVSELMRRFGFSRVWVEKDLAGKDRVVCGRLNNVEKSKV